MADARTLAVYAEKAGEYAALAEDQAASVDLTRFVAALPAGARVLEFGCGPGLEAAQMMAAGLDVDAVDASAEMVAEAKARGVAARVGRFEELDAVSEYDGVWASFSLLHAEREDLPGIFAAMGRALAKGGVLYVALKTGQGMARDALGRRYTYLSEDELAELFAIAGCRVDWRRHGEGKGLAGTVDPYVMMLGVKA